MPTDELSSGWHLTKCHSECVDTMMMSKEAHLNWDTGGPSI